LNPGLALTGQDGWVTNDPKGRGEPAGESDGLTRLVLPDGETSLAAYIGGPYRAAYPPGRTNVMLWPEINGLGATLKFTVSILIQPSDSNGIYSESDTFAWTFIDDTNAPMFSIAFEPTEDDSELRKITVLNGNGSEVNLEEQNFINIRQLYKLEVLMIPNENHVSVSANLSNAISKIDFAILDLPACSTERVTGIAANWIMTGAKVHENGIVTGFGSNYMAFDNYALSTDSSVYVGIDDEKVSESEQFVIITASICDPLEKDTVINYEMVDGSAIAGLDYEIPEALLVIPAGQISANLEIPIMEDSLNEENEFFSVRFSTEAQKIKFIDSEITVTIENSYENLKPVIADQTFAVQENSLKDMIIRVIVATDPNKDDLSFSITSSTDPNGNGTQALIISGNQLLVNDSDDLDFEEQAVLQITVTVSDGELTDQATITVNLNDDREEDADGDGLTEAQEEDIYNTSDTNADTDEDKYADSCEVLFKSLPNNAESVPAFKIKINILKVDQFELLFPGKKGVLYSVQTSDDMKTWLSLEKLIIGQGDPIQEIFSISRSNSGYYWRVKKE